MENKGELISQLTTLFEKNLSDPVRKRLIGPKVDKILSIYFDRISSEQLAIALLSKYGCDLFKPRYHIFETIVNRLDLNELGIIAMGLGLNQNSPDLYNGVIKLISSNLKFFISHFGQSQYFLTSKPKDERSTSESIDVRYEQQLESLGYPHPYQNDVKLELIRKIANSSMKFSALVVMPTGSGKTRTAIEFMIDFIRSRSSSNIIWIVERPELSEQALNSFKNLWQLRGDRPLFIHRCFDKFNPDINFSPGTNIVFAGLDKLNILKQNQDSYYLGQREKTNLMIIDEAHFSLAETYEEVISDIENKSKNILKIGLTATPMRADDNELYNLKKYFQNRTIDFKDDYGEVVNNPIEYLQDRDYLATLKIEYLSLPSNEIREDSLELNDKVIKRIKSSIDEEKQVIVFAMSKDHAVALDILLKHKDIRSECIIGDTAPVERQKYFKDFQNKELNVLVNFDILSTGIDLPVVDELYILRKFGQYTTAMQVLGRALRGKNNGGNVKNRVISIKSNKNIIEDPSDLYNLIKNMYT